MSKRNTEGKYIRFIDSHYKDLFRIPDGSCIQIHYPDETVIKPCTFIDEYHTRIGYNDFHICQFAEIMERNGATYMAEPVIMGNEAAWRVGKDMILTLQMHDENYDYTLCDINFNKVDVGRLDNPELSMIEARTQILESYDLGSRDLRAIIYQEVMEQIFENAKRTNPKTIWFRAGMEAQVSDEEMSILTNGSDHQKAHQLMKKIICRSVLSGETYILSNYDLDGYDNPDKEIDFCFDREPLSGEKKFKIDQTYTWTDWFTGGTTQFVVKSIENGTITMSAVRHELDGIHTQDESFPIETDEKGNERILMTEYAGQKGYICAA